MRRLPAIALLSILAAVPAAACLNDSETHSAEQEFRSSYLDPHAAPAHERGVVVTTLELGHLWFASPVLVLVGVLWWRAKRRLPGPGQRSSSGK